NFRSTMMNIEQELLKLGISASQISGGVGKEERELIIDAFKANGVKVLISNPQTLAESVSLHDICHDAVYCELNLNLAQFVQSKDRIHRLGLNDNQYTQYHFVFAEYDGKSLDKNTLALLEEKEATMNEFLEKGDFNIEYYETTEEEIKQLLGGDLVD
ncbi:MAG: helicase-related protein, partial [Coprobacillaceae bacterium]